MRVYEIVRVLDAKCLRNSEAALHEYDSGRRGGLEPGFYVVGWPELRKELVYDATASWHGPHKSRRSALIVMSIMRTEPQEPVQKPPRNKRMSVVSFA